MKHLTERQRKLAITDDQWRQLDVICRHCPANVISKDQLDELRAAVHAVKVAINTRHYGRN